MKVLSQKVTLQIFLALYLQRIIKDTKDILKFQSKNFNYMLTCKMWDFEDSLSPGKCQQCTEFVKSASATAKPTKVTLIL